MRVAAIGLLVTALAAPVFADDWRKFSDRRFHERDRYRHYALHNDLRWEHDAFHRYPYSRGEHKQFHKELKRDHKDFHRYQRRGHDGFHFHLFWRR